MRKHLLAEVPVKRFLFDLNVVLDVLFSRRRASPKQRRATGKPSKQGRLFGLLPAHGFTTIHCLVRQQKGVKIAGQALTDLLNIFHVASVDQAVIHQATALNWTDFEDTIIAAAAEVARCDAVVSRDPAGFSGVSVPVLTPKAALALLQSEPEAS